MDSEYGQHGDRVNKMVNAILFTLIGSVATVLVLQLLHMQTPSDGNGRTVLFPFQNTSLATQLWIQIVLLVGTNGLVMVACDLLPPRRILQNASIVDVRRLLDNAIRGIRWGFVNYFAWGTFSAIVQAIAVPVKDVSLSVFFTAATIGGSFHCPLCHFAFYYIGERVLYGTTEDDLYSLNRKALLRLIVPNGIAGVGAGVFFGYFSSILPQDSVMTTIYDARYQVAIFLIIWLLFLWLFFYTIDQNSFMRRALAKHNVFRVWMTFFVCWLAGLLVGTEAYEKILLSYALVSQ